MILVAETVVAIEVVAIETDSFSLLHRGSSFRPRCKQSAQAIRIVAGVIVIVGDHGVPRGLSIITTNSPKAGAGPVSTSRLLWVMSL
jgi:hypothetical protein